MSENKTISAETEVKEEIFLTDAAIKEVDRLISQQSDNENLMLRIGVEGGGCSGLSYIMSFAKAIDEFDTTFDFDNLKVVVDGKSLVYMAGTTIDFSDEILSGGFRFSNPQSTRGCGCGTSFSV